MCGIAGLYYFDDARTVESGLLTKMNDSIAHRGPDDSGIYINGPVGLAHRRLSIIDLSANGHQPFGSNDGRYQLIFNGEIYNYGDHIQLLKNKGYQFKSHSDTEVLLYLFMEYGLECLNMLNGMFAFAVWDNQLKELVIARDRIGIKPLYYAKDANLISFASEIKALIRGNISKEIYEEGFEELLMFKYVAGENTVFKHVKRLLPGHYMRVRKDKFEIKQWYNLSDKIVHQNKQNSDAFDQFESLFNNSVKSHVISDVPIGVLLSGGLDSSSIALSIYQQKIKNISAFNVGFKGTVHDESALAKLVADQYEMDFYTIGLNGEHLLNELTQATWFHDEPLIHQNDAQLLALSKFSKDKVSVLLSGEGADELLGGYVRYKPLVHYKFIPLLSLGLKAFNSLRYTNRFDKFIRYTSSNDPNNLILYNASNIYPVDLEKYAIKINSEKFEYRQKIIREGMSAYPSNPVRATMYSDLFTHMSSVLDRNDRMTMGASIECRVPFLDHRMIEMGANLPNDKLLKGPKGKFILYNSIAKKLPKQIRNFRKVGFSVPWENYLQDDPAFKAEIDEMLNSDLFKIGIFEKINVRELYKEFYQENHLSKSIFRQFFMLHMWYKYYYQAIN